MGRADDARRFIAKGLAMQNTEKDDPETKREGRELLANFTSRQKISRWSRRRIARELGIDRETVGRCA